MEFFHSKFFFHYVTIARESATFLGLLNFHYDCSRNLWYEFKLNYDLEKHTLFALLVEFSNNYNKGWEFAFKNYYMQFNSRKRNAWCLDALIRIFVLKIFFWQVYFAWSRVNFTVVGQSEIQQLHTFFFLPNNLKCFLVFIFCGL